MSDLIVPGNFDLNGLTIETLDGETLTLQPGQSVMDLLPGGGGGKPLWRLAVTQDHRDERLPGHPDTFFLSRQTRRLDEQGNLIKHTEVIPLGNSVRAWPLGMTANRSYFASKYDPNNPAEAPDCRSENFVTPDAAYAGKISPVCARLDPRTGKLMPACPMAQWGAKGADGKSLPPRCNEQYVLFLAVSVDHGDSSGSELVVCKAYFKSASASAGKAAIQTLRAIQAKGLPIWTFPVDILMKVVGKGTTYVPLVRTDIQHDYTDEDRSGLAMAVHRAEDALRFQAERAARVEDEQAAEAEQNAPPRPAMREQEIVQEAAPVGTVGAGNHKPAAPKNGKSKQVDPLI